MFPLEFFRDVLEIQLLPWQQDCLASIYGTDSEVPVVSEFYFSGPKKQGKTWFFGGGLSLYHILCQPYLKNALALTVASSREQAALTYDSTVDMIRNSKALSELVESGRLEVFRDNLLYHGKTGDRLYQVIANEASTAHGKRPTFCNIDELQTFSGPKAQEIVDTMITSQRQCAHPLVIYTAHAGYDLNSIAADKEALIAQYQSGVINQPRGFAYRIYRASDKHPWDSIEAFAEANPAYPHIIQKEAYEREVENARQTPNFERSYRCFVLNQWTSQANAMVNMTDWKDCQDDYTEDDLEGLPCHAGFDASTYDDLTAFSLVFPMDDGTLRTLVHAFIPEERLADKENRDKVPYFQWSEQGYLHLTPGSVIDQDYVRDVMLEAAERYELREVAYDPHRARGIINALVGAGIPCVEHRTGMISMAEPTAQFMKHVVAHTLKHNGNPLLTWNVGNLRVREDQTGNQAPKKGTRTEKIDAAFALILALGIAVEHNQKPEPFVSYYAQAGATT